MLGISKTIVATVAFVAATSSLAKADEPFLGPAPAQGILILRNGHVIEGKISRAGEVYYVALANGEIRVRAAQVEYCCRTLEEGYRHLRAAIPVGSVHDHLRLAGWCQRHTLYGLAARELADAMDADPTHPMIGVIDRRLRTAMAPKQPPAGPPAKKADSAPSPEDLDRMIRGMPRGTVETFTQVIQPLLTNNCTAAACHGPASESEFRLARIPVDRPPSRRLTQRNLHATLQWIDTERPADSLLLKAPIGPHGSAKTAVFTDRQVGQYRQLVDWAHRIAEHRRARVPATVVLKDQPPVHAMPAESDRFAAAASAVAPAKYEESADNPFRYQAGPKRGARPPQFLPVDPFDAEIFNRQYFGPGEQGP